MTEFFTLLVLTYPVPDLGTVESVLLYPSMDACGDALSAVYGTVERHFRGGGAQCIPTPLLSHSLRPVARPF